MEVASKLFNLNGYLPSQVAVFRVSDSRVDISSTPGLLHRCRRWLESAMRHRKTSWNIMSRSLISEAFPWSLRFGLRVRPHAAIAHSRVHVLVVARVFLAKFSLRGEADETDRILTAFAKHFHTQNPVGSLSADQAYFLAAATVLLNGDLHNPVCVCERGFLTRCFVFVWLVCVVFFTKKKKKKKKNWNLVAKKTH